MGEKLTETFEVVTADGTKGTVTVTINGTNDAPVISGQASGEVTDGGNTSATGQLGKTDVDVNDTPHLVRQQRRQGQVRHLHRRPDRQVDL